MKQSTWAFAAVGLLAAVGVAAAFWRSGPIALDIAAVIACLSAAYIITRYPPVATRMVSTLSGAQPTWLPPLLRLGWIFLLAGVLLISVFSLFFMAGIDLVALYYTGLGSLGLGMAALVMSWALTLIFIWTSAFREMRKQRREG